MRRLESSVGEFVEVVVAMDLVGSVKDFLPIILKVALAVDVLDL